MKKLSTLIFALLLYIPFYGQYDQPSVGVGYANQCFYNIGNGATLENPHTDWDIAFSTDGFDAAIFVNEGAGSSMGIPIPSVECYYGVGTDFDQIDTTGMTFFDNDEVSWAAGAFNLVADDSDPFDFGWGTYDYVSHSVNGTRVFVIKLRNGIFKKIKFTALINGEYQFKYADLDGNNLVELAINKADFVGKTLVYYSIENEALLDIEPNSWDLQFTRYIASIDDGFGNFVDYNVTGVLSNRGTQVAQASGVDPYYVDFSEYKDLLSDTLDIIGHDWKFFDLNTFSWELQEDLVYFVKTSSDSLWKIHFLDFEGSSTGVTTLEKTFETTVTKIDELESDFNYLEVFPNPAMNQINVAFEGRSASEKAEVRLIDNLGKSVAKYQFNMHSGMNIKSLSLHCVPGHYNLVISLGDSQPEVRKVIIY